MMKFVLIRLAVMALAVTGCDSGSPNKMTPAPTATLAVTAEATGAATATVTEPVTTTADVSKCPVDSATCEIAERFVSAWKAKDVDALMAMAKPLATRCPVPRPSGLGGPYPLCDDATADGEMREGFVWSSGTHGGLWGAEAMRGQLERVVQAERPLLTIGCAVVESTNQCEGHFLLSFGTFPFGAIAQLADLPVYRAEGESGGLIGILPVFVGNCTKAEDGFACERVVGGTGSNPGYWYWGDETQLPRPLPEWTFFRWTP
jgi:hypothetical protein